jgi:hypothetical protein
MLNEEHERMMLAYLSSLLTGGKILRSSADLCAMNTHELLVLAEKVDDSALGLFVQMLKATGEGARLFEKLMGEHEEENRPLVDAFFTRYLNVVLSGVEEGRDYNPLEVYMPLSVLDDLVFIQSRQAFFMRQTIETINDYLNEIFGGAHHFQVGEQEQAWSFFWDKVLSR